MLKISYRCNCYHYYYSCKFVGWIYITDSPGYLLISDAHGISYYFTLSAKLEAAASDAFTPVTEEDFILADGISGDVCSVCAHMHIFVCICTCVQVNLY